MFYFSVTGTLVSATPLLWIWRTPEPTVLAAMGAAGVCATLGQLLLTHSYSLASAARIGPYTYSSVVFAAFFGWLFWRESLDRWTALGAVLICISGALAMRREPSPITG